MNKLIALICLHSSCG